MAFQKTSHSPHVHTASSGNDDVNCVIIFFFCPPALFKRNIRFIFFHLQFLNRSFVLYVNFSIELVLWEEHIKLELVLKYCKCVAVYAYLRRNTVR